MRLDDLPSAGRVSLGVGGGNKEVLQAAATRADVVALSGLGRTLPDGHRHEVRWAPSDLHARLQLIREQSHRSGRAPEIEVLVHFVTVTEDRAAVLADLSEQLQGPSPEVLAKTPFVLVGTTVETADQLVRQSELLGISRYVMREPAIEILQRVLPLLK